MDPASSSSDVADASEYTREEMLITSILTMNNENGVDVDALFEFLEESFELPPDYRNDLEEELTELVSQNKLDKVENRYKIRDGTVTLGTNPTETLNPEDSTEPQELSSEKILEITEAAAKAVAVADSKELEAKEAHEVAIKTIKLAEESALILEIAQEVADRCAKGETVFLQ